jgi:putative PIN family toxin of toxin-antitoxin system
MASTRRGPRSVIDTNLFVSGIIVKRGNPFNLLEAWRAGLFAVLMSDEQRAELDVVLHRPIIQKKYGISAEEITTLFHLLDMTAAWVGSRRRLPVKVRDSKDEMILGSALGGKADYLITGDKDLLALRGEPGLGSLRIITVVEFLSVLAGGHTET